MRDARHVFICSSSFSGSTLLDMLIGSHRDCESLGEVALLPLDLAENRSCCCGTPIRECVLWSEVARRLALDPENDPDGLNLGFLRSRPDNPPWARAQARLGYGLSYYHYLYKLSIPRAGRARFEEGIHNTFRVYEAVRAITGKQIVVDSSKHHTRAVALYSAQPQSVRIIDLVRDGRGVFYSGLRKGFGRKRSLDSWRRHYAHARPLLERCVDARHVMRVRYEDVVAHPERTLSALCAFLAIAYDPAMVDFRGVVHHNVNGNDMKYARDTGIVVNETWKQRLSQSDLQYFERKAGTMNRALGYA